MNTAHYCQLHFTMMNQAAITDETKTNSDYSLQLNRWFLKPIGAWPLFSTTTKLEKIVSLILNIVCYAIVILCATPSLMQIILAEESFYLKLKTLGPVSHWFVSTVNYTALLMKSKDIRYCFEHMEADWQTIKRMEDQRTMLKNAKFGRYVAASCAIFMQGGILCFCFVTILTTETIQVGNETRVLHVLPCAVYKELVNVEESSINIFMLCFQFVAAAIANSSTVGIFSLAAVLAAHAYGQLSVVMVWITEFVNQSREQKKTDDFKEIGMIVERHLRVLNFITYLENIMNRIYFLELFRCTMIICIVGYYILTEWAEKNVQNLTTYFMMLLSICFNIFIICYIGEILTEQCMKIGEVVYMTDWYYLPDKTILNLILIILRSTVVVQITAGKLFNMSVYTFGDVLKTAFAYLNLLRQMT